MRVLVLATATDRLGPRLAGGVVGQAFARRGHQVAVVPMAERADQLASALADLSEPTACLVPASARATELAAAVRAQASAGATTVLVDLSADVALDLAASGAAPVVGIDLIGVVSADQLTLPLVGARGVAARAGFASGEDRAQVLARDAAYAQLAERLQVEPGPGAGAAGGGGLLVLALGGRLASAPQVLAELSGLEHSLAQADLVVLVMAALDFGGTGVALARVVAGWAESAAVACIVVAERMVVSARELRSWGIESGYGLTPGDDLVALARRVAATWSW